ncbi:MAG: HNH endonuclease [Ruminococcus sp.]|nr:HNH endonuclease [Candidatus Copronaster equi]
MNMHIIKICEWCGKEFEATRSFQKFCSNKCKVRNQRGYKGTNEEAIQRRRDEAKKKYIEILNQYDCDFIDYYRINGYGYIVGRCKQCGKDFTIFRVSLLSSENEMFGTCCPICKARIKLEEKRISEISRQIAREQKREQKQNEIEKQFIKEHTKKCIICGKEFYAKHLGLICCSDECYKELKKKYNRLHPKDKMKRIPKENIIDKDISVIKLYERDYGICKICGKPCDLNDKYIDDKGTIICGDNYPSIDHIIPVSKGGIHSWDNVQLAHRKCNTLKRDWSNLRIDEYGQVIMI